MKPPPSPTTGATSRNHHLCRGSHGGKFQKHPTLGLPLKPQKDNPSALKELFRGPLHGVWFQCLLRADLGSGVSKGLSCRSIRYTGDTIAASDRGSRGCCSPVRAGNPRPHLGFLPGQPGARPASPALRQGICSCASCSPFLRALPLLRRPSTSQRPLL